MPELEKATDDKIVEIDGIKYLEDPDNPGKALKDDAGQSVAFEGADSTEEDEEKETDEEKKKEKKPAPPAADDDDAEPPVRKSVKDYIIERKQKKIEKLQKQEEGEEEEGEELTPDGAKAISKAVDERVAPITNALKRQSDEKELQEVFAAYGDEARKMEKTVRKYMDHPSYAAVPVELIYLGLAAKKHGIKLPDKTKEKNDADAEAEKSRIGAGGKRKKEGALGKIPDVTQMSDKEVDELATQVKTGQFNQE